VNVFVVSFIFSVANALLKVVRALLSIKVHPLNKSRNSSLLIANTSEAAERLRSNLKEIISNK
jgi:hypothetical protein